MNVTESQNETALRRELDESRGRLAELASELDAIDAELEGLTGERLAHEILYEVCGSLEKLDEQGESDLFWAGLAPGESGRAHLVSVRDRVDAFQKRIGAIQDSRQTLVSRMREEEAAGAYLADDLDEIEREAEERRNLWEIERDPCELPPRPTLMPWTRGADEARLRKELGRSLALALLLGALLPWIPLPVPEKWEVIEVDERWTRLIEARVEPPPAIEMPAPVPEPVPTEQLMAEQAVEPAPPSEAAPEPPARAKGLLAFREQFSALSAANDARLGSEARVSRSGEVARGRATRSLVTSTGPGSSGGIDLASLSRDVGGAGGRGMQGVEVARATSSIGIGGGGAGDRPLAGGPGSARTDEEIQIVFDRHKASLYRLYNRALRNNPALQGQIVLKMTIEPDGSVSFCAVHGSDMQAPQLGAQVVERVKTFDFGAKEGIPAITFLYPIDFLPAA